MYVTFWNIRLFTYAWQCVTPVYLSPPRFGLVAAGGNAPDAVGAAPGTAGRLRRHQPPNQQPLRRHLRLQTGQTRQ